ncbi:MAG: Asp23/Gls24 family envelope stress response protein [Caldisericaceae bacterium]
MSKIILSTEALKSIIEEALLKIDGVAKLPNRNSVNVEHLDSIISVFVKITAVFGFNLVRLSDEIKKTIKLEVESITPFKVNEISIEFEDVVNER